MKKKFALATLAVSAASNLGNMAYGNCKAILQASAMFVLLSVGFMLVSCRQDVSLQESFPTETMCDGGVDAVDAGDLVSVEGMSCNDSVLVVLDFHGGNSYSLFDLHTGRHVRRLGRVGNGNGEIPLGCNGSVHDGCMYAFHDMTGRVVRYPLDTFGEGGICEEVCKYGIEEGLLAMLLPCGDHTFLGMGTYKDRYHYVLFDDSSKVLDYGVEVYNAGQESFDRYCRFLSNQGCMVRHPSMPWFASAIYYSGNIDFLRVCDGGIDVVESYRYGNPDYVAEVVGGMSQVVPTADTRNGVLDLCANSSHVFALYSDKRILDEPYCSDRILVFDWSGSRRTVLRFPHPIYHISATDSHLYLHVKDGEGNDRLERCGIPDACRDYPES